ncbi:MAG: isochorismatase family protein [Actinomycetota bacterium]|nr:isochorismatase family protein [Actinomycetota bacterium]
MARYDDRTALIVADVQNDFADPAGSLYVPGGEEVIERVNAEVDRAMDAGSVVVYTQDWHPPSTPHFEKDGGVWPVHCVVETWGAELHPRLRVIEGAPIVRKGTGGEDGYSGFTVRDPTSGEEHSTVLEDLLRERGVRRTTVVGLATDYCVKETALDALAKGFETTVLTDAVRAVERRQGDGSRALEELREAGASVV